ncbi:hypothetical protein LDENG_00288070 [Lucifuga dentata]|nr:hypothetical protein LDENG_00288070 [Lucifuga dentata]
MLKERSNSNSGRSHKCRLSCLGPLSFHLQTVGDMVHLSHRGQLANRTEHTFKNGLVFSSRPLEVQERLHLRVEKNVPNWHGALRVGFTNVPPTARALPLPSMAVPDLTNTPGHWAAPVHESYCQAGSELEFWFSCGGNMYLTSDNCRQQKLLAGLDLSKPLWAMIDLYGQTSSVFLLGSMKKKLFYSRRSCPAVQHISSPNDDNYYNMNRISNVLSEDSDECLPFLTPEIPTDANLIMECVVCLGNKAKITLQCGHQCLCGHCATRIIQEFGTCPLCRQMI